MRQHNDVSRQSSPTALGQDKLTERWRHSFFLAAIVVVAIAGLACASSGPSTGRIVIVTRLPTLTRTPLPTLTSTLMPSSISTDNAEITSSHSAEPAAPAIALAPADANPVPLPAAMSTESAPAAGQPAETSAESAEK